MDEQRRLDIKRLRVKAGMTQMQLAKLVGVSLNSVVRWENFCASPSESNYQKLSKIFGLRD
jgi:DNA-binding XRE family transcriptional regulator